MRCFPLAVAAALLALVVVPNPAAAECTPTTSPSVEIPVHEQPPLLLATNHLDQGLALYQESGARPGLQRNDGGHDDTCGGAYPADTLVRFVTLL